MKKILFLLSMLSDYKKKRRAFFMVKKYTPSVLEYLELERSCGSFMDAEARKENRLKYNISEQDLSNFYGVDYPDDIYEIDYNLTNIVIIVPANGSEKTNDAILFTAHLDSVPMGPGASDDAVAVSVLLEAANHFKGLVESGELVINNDLVFALFDGEEYGLLGSHEFVDNFNGFNNLLNRCKFAINLESRGTSGTLIMFETSPNNYNTIEMFAKINKNAFTSSIANMVYSMMPNGTDFSSYSSQMPGINLANLGGGYNYHTQNDNYRNVGMSYLTQQCNIVEDSVYNLGNYDLDLLSQSEVDAIFFSYLNAGTIYYSKTVGIILGCLALILIVTIIAIQIVRKENNLLKTLKGFAVIGIIIVVNALVGLISYYVFQLCAAFFGVINIHIIGKVNYSSVGIIVGLMVLCLGLTYVLNLFLMKKFKIESKDVRRAMAYFLGGLSAILSFAIFEASYLFIFTAILMLGYELSNELVKNENYHNLHLTPLIFSLSMPILFPVIILASTALGIKMAYVYTSLLSIICLLFVPECVDMLEYFTISYHYNKMYPYRPKKDIKVMKSAIAILVLGILTVFFAVVTPSNVATNYQGKQSTFMLPYDDAICYIIDDDHSYYQISDLDAYQVINDYVEGYHYDKTLRSYIKEDKNPTFKQTGLSTIIFEEKTIDITRVGYEGYVEVVIPRNSNITEVKVQTNNNEYKVEVENGNSTTLRLNKDSHITFITNNNEPINCQLTVIDLLLNYEYIREYGDNKLTFRDILIKYNLIKVTTYNN